MWISKKEWRALEEKVSDLEKKTEDLTQGMLMKICTNSVMKEQYNFDLLRFLFKKLDIEVPESEYEFAQQELSSDKSSQRSGAGLFVPNNHTHKMTSYNHGLYCKNTQNPITDTKFRPKTTAFQQEYPIEVIGFDAYEGEGSPISRMHVKVDLSTVSIPDDVWKRVNRIPVYDAVNEMCRYRILLQHLRDTRQKIKIVKYLNCGPDDIKSSQWSDVFQI